MRPLVQIQNLCWRYESSGWVLSNVNLVIQPGERIGLVGWSGSGKSTLALTLNGIIPQSYAGALKGQVVVCGRDTTATPVSDLAREVAMVFQSPDDQMSQILVCHEVASGPANLGLPSKEVQKRVSESLDRVRIGNLADRETNTLSGGEKQKVALAAALAMKPRLLVLDEPTTDLDPSSKTEIMELLRDLDHDTSIVVVSHDLENIAPLVGRLVVLNQGEVAANISTPELPLLAEVSSSWGISLPQMVAFGVLLRNLYPDWPQVTTLGQAASLLDHKLPHLKAPDKTPLFGEEEVVLENVSYRYPGSDAFAIKNFSLTVRKGEIVAIIGNNGSGKTTLSKLVLGLLRPTHGKVIVAGREVKRIHPDLIGYIFQNPDEMLSQLRVDEEVAFTPRILGLKGWANRTSEMLGSFGLNDFAARFPLSLSKGQRQRLAYAAAIAAKPRILIFDEPTTGLDRPACDAIMHYMDDLRTEGRTILFITHDMALALKWADRIVIMNEGKLAHVGQPSSVSNLRDDLLAKYHLSLPPITELARKIGVEGLVVTPEHMVQLIKGGVG